MSIVMPVRNEGAYIDRSLGAVLAQDYPPDLIEVLLIDGGSDDDTRQRARVLAERHPGVEIRILDNPKRIVSHALNIALAAARGEVIARVDGHCEIAPDYVRNGVRHLIEDEVDGVGGPLETVGEGEVARCIALAMSSRFGVGGAAFRTAVGGDARRVDTVAFPVYSRQAIERAGGFDEELVRNQDDEYNYRLRKLGGEILLAPDLRARYYSRSNFRTLWRQYLQYGYFKVRVLQKHTGQMKARQFVPAAFVLTLLTLLVPIPAVRLVGLLAAAAYVLASVLAAVTERRRTGWRDVPLLILAFAAMHVGYGVGFLAGLARFAHRWGDRQGRVPPLPPFAADAPGDE
ncbi:MAG: glycosyltransferase family 2 protein [bacterium]|nr:glycosyltransferase family 2 protein [bacterium]